MKKILGTMHLPETPKDIEKWLRAAHTAGYDWLDSAWLYGQDGGNEKRLGPVLTYLRGEGITFKIQSKVWPTNYLEIDLYFKKSLQALEIEKFDAILLHRPSINLYESVEAWKYLIQAKQHGLVKEIGVSNFENEMLEILFNETKVWPSINQIENSITNIRQDRIIFNKAKNIELQAWAILGKDVAKNLNEPIVLKIAKKHKVKPVQVLISFSVALGFVPVIGTTKIERLADSLNWIELKEKEVEILRALNTYDHRSKETF